MFRNMILWMCYIYRFKNKYRHGGMSIPLIFLFVSFPPYIEFITDSYLWGGLKISVLLFYQEYVLLDWIYVSLKDIVNNNNIEGCQISYFPYWTEK